ncbi:MAG: aminotransferase class I/II-fold pyridoxal phosphate-dependent enzyme, partial [Anderseniella sp.]
WSVEPNTIFTTHGLVNGTALCIHAFTKPGDSVILFTPVYHAFARVIKAAGRDVLESRLVNNNGRYELDLDTLQAQLTGKETMLIFCSPHNPGGRVWTPAELVSVALFCEKNNLLLVSDEIHHDLVFEGNTHTVMPNAAPDMMHRIVTMTAASKTFNLAGAHSGNVIISDARLHKQFSDALMSYGISGNSFGLTLTEAAYNDGEDWLIQLIAYLDENRKVFDAGINAIPGLRSMPLQATYLAWVDFSSTGMSHDEIKSRVKNDARIATNDGPSFGSGGDFFQRFNLACPRAQVKEAVARMQRAFADIQ